MIIMKNWRSNTVDSVDVLSKNIANNSLDPQEGSSGQCDITNQSIYKLLTNNASSTVSQVVDISKHAKIIHQLYSKRFHLRKITENETVNGSMELLRSCIQNAFDQEVDIVIKKFIQLFFVPALQNLKSQQNDISIQDDILCEICCSLLDKSKEQYLSQIQFIMENARVSLSTATTPKMELSETDSDASSSNAGFGMKICTKIEPQDMDDSSNPITKSEPMDEKLPEDILGKFAEGINDEDFREAFSFEDSLLSDIPCISLSPPPIMDALLSNDFKVPLPPISTITSSLSKPYAPFSSMFGSNKEPCLDLIDFDFE